MSLEETPDALAARPNPRKISIMIYFKKGKNFFAFLLKTHGTKRLIFLTSCLGNFRAATRAGVDTYFQFYSEQAVPKQE